MTGLDSLDQFFQPLHSSRKPKRLSKKERRLAIRQYKQRQQGYGQEQGLGLFEMLKSKEFKERVELVKKGSKLVSREGRLAAIRIAARLKQKKSMYSTNRLAEAKEKLSSLIKKKKGIYD